MSGRQQDMALRPLGLNAIFFTRCSPHKVGLVNDLELLYIRQNYPGSGYFHPSEDFIMTKRPFFTPATGLLLLIIGLTALVIKSAQDSLTQALLAALFFLLAAGYFTARSFEGEKRWWMILPAGLSFTVAAIVLLRHFDPLKSHLLWALFFCGAGLTLFLYWKNRPHALPEKWARNGAILCALLALFQYLGSFRFMDHMTLVALLLFAAGILLLMRKR